MAEAVLNRTTFRTSREMDFFSEKELVTQTGHSKDEWLYVFLKETIDNSLDACEEANIAPSIDVIADECGVSVKDNGPGLPTETLAGALDFTVRASNREMYVAPDRGAQGNALMTLLAMPYVLDSEQGGLVVTAGGVKHSIVCRADPISQRAVVHHDQQDVETTQGTEIRIEWAAERNSDGDVVWPFDKSCCPRAESQNWYRRPKQITFDLLSGYAVFNPHLTLKVDWFGENMDFEATNPEWLKWTPSKPTSPHWYEQRHLERLVAAYITHDRDRGADRTIADFVAEFDGLTGSQKRAKVLNETGLKRKQLSELATDDGLDSETIGRLLEAMISHTRPIQPRRLGIIGEKHLRTRLEGMGCVPESIEYKKVARIDGGLPFVLESIFGWKGEGATDRRQIFAGANWSAAIKNPFRSFGQTGEGLDSLLSELRAGAHEPIVHVVHVAHPRVEYTDRGKSALVIRADDDE